MIIIVLFLSAVWALILTVPIHSRGSVNKWCNAKCLQISLNDETNLSTYNIS